jgi:hypothetical protein
MPKINKRALRNGNAKTNHQLTKELAQLKREVRILRDKCSQAYRAVLAICCPKEWYTDKIDPEEALKQAIFEPSIQEVIESLSRERDRLG